MKSDPRSASARESSARDVPTLPVWKAFVVQFSRDTRATDGPFAGRIEHMSSGRRAPFYSAEEFMAAMRTMIEQLGDPDA